MGEAKRRHEGAKAEATRASAGVYEMAFAQRTQARELLAAGTFIRSVTPAIFLAGLAAAGTLRQEGAWSP